jgi:hypothetical protein
MIAAGTAGSAALVGEREMAFRRDFDAPRERFRRQTDFRRAKSCPSSTI